MKKIISFILIFSLLAIAVGCNKPITESSQASESLVSESRLDNSLSEVSEALGNSDMSNEEKNSLISLAEPTSSQSSKSKVSSSNVEQSSAQSTSTGIDWGNIGSSQLVLLSPKQGSMSKNLNPKFTWSSIDASSYTFILEIKNGSSYQQVEKKTGLKKNEYQLTNNLKAGSTYKWRAEAIKDGKTSSQEGNIFMAKTDYKNHPTNKGLNFSFKNAVSEQVLKNFLSRSITMSLLSVPSSNYESDIRLIFNTGAKYISRAIIPWEAEVNYDDAIKKYKEKIDFFHTIDPEIVFETCIFETVFKSCEQVSIPGWVFTAFNQPVVKRNFSYNKMLFTSGKYLNHWGDGASVPDITQLETQMYFYYRGCRYIDAGFEGIHWGQVMLMGENDTGHQDYHKLLKMIRKYALNNARRGFVFNNAHTHGMLGPDNVLLFDFHSYPLRIRTKPGESAHAPTQKYPQKTIFEKGHIDAIYGKSLGGKTYSGWTCSSLPYFVEIDNYGGVVPGKENQPNINYHPWGMDEISWFVNQPDDYRKEWIDYAYNWVKANDSAGYISLTGSRPAYVIKEGRITWYYANNKDSGSGYWGDEEAIKNTWQKYR